MNRFYVKIPTLILALAILAILIFITQPNQTTNNITGELLKFGTGTLNENHEIAKWTDDNDIITPPGCISMLYIFKSPDPEIKIQATATFFRDNQEIRLSPTEFTVPTNKPYGYTNVLVDTPSTYHADAVEYRLTAGKTVISKKFKINKQKTLSDDIFEKLMEYRKEKSN